MTAGHYDVIIIGNGAGAYLTATTIFADGGSCTPAPACDMTRTAAPIGDQL